VNQLKLRMYHGYLQQKIHIVRTQIAFPCLQIIQQAQWAGRNKARLLDRAALLANPVLVNAKFPRCLVLTAHTVHQDAV
jgi:hypothetical protein